MSTIIGADELARDLQRLGDNMPQVERAMLEAGGQVMAQAWQSAIDAHGFVLTGSMRDNVRPKVRKVHGSQRAEITSLGADDHKVRNAAKAYILHYGTSRISASHWIDGAEQEGTGPSVDAMGRVLGEAIESNI